MQKDQYTWFRNQMKLKVVSTNYVTLVRLKKKFWSILERKCQNNVILTILI